MIDFLIKWLIDWLIDGWIDSRDDAWIVFGDEPEASGSLGRHAA